MGLTDADLLEIAGGLDARVEIDRLYPTAKERENAKNRERYKHFTPEQKARRLANGRRHRERHRDEINAKRRAVVKTDEWRARGRERTRRWRARLKARSLEHAKR